MTTLSVCIPTFERETLLERALRSVIEGSERVANDIEIVVSDDSQDDRSAAVCERLLAEWPGSARRVQNRPGLGMVENFNRCVVEATGRYVLILHDDDYLLPGGAVAVLEAIVDHNDDSPVLLFGVDVVDDVGRLRRRQSFEFDTHVPPSDALVRLLSNSSYVRFPGIVVRADAYAVAGPFDATLGGTTDFDMWIRLFARHGVRCVPRRISAYSVHRDAHTTGMFNPATISTLVTIFDRVIASGVMEKDVVRRCEADFFSQFILGGAYRQLRLGDREHAREIMALSNLPAVRGLGPSRRWRPVRLAISVLIRAPGPLLSRTARLLERLYPDTSILWPS